jgi:hypothetical protein
VLLGLLSASPLAAQDAYQWSEAYGTQANLLGGVVVGSVPDLSATFYNPGRLASIESAGVALTSRTFEYRTLNLKVEQTTFDGGEDVGTSAFSVTPSFLAGVIPLKGGRTVLGYTFLTRQDTEERIAIEQEGPNPPDGPFGAVLAYSENRVGENWGGVSWAHRTETRVGFGVTVFVAQRGQRIKRVATVQAIDSGVPTIAGSTIRAFEYNDWRLVVKPGISARFANIDFGATVTLPGIHLYGSGGALYTDNYIATSDSTAGLYAWREQKDLTSSFASPLSIAAGAAWRHGSTTFYASAEWTAALPKRNVVDADSIVPADPRAPFESDLVYARRSVVNWGVGIEERLRPKFALYGYFSTDPSARAPNEKVNLTFTTWDRWHAGGGASFALGDLDLIGGLSYTWGGSDLDLDDESIGSGFPGVTSASIRERSLRALIAFELTL